MIAPSDPPLANKHSYIGCQDSATHIYQLQYKCFAQSANSKMGQQHDSQIHLNVI